MIATMLTSAGLNLLKNVFIKKGKKFVEDKFDVDIEEMLSSEEGIRQLRTLELEHEKFLVESLHKQDEETTERWVSDNLAGILPRLVRPLTLVYLIIIYTVLALVDGNVGGFVIKEVYVKGFNEMLWIAFPAYFGLRTLEKLKGKDKTAGGMKEDHDESDC